MRPTRTLKLITLLLLLAYFFVIENFGLWEMRYMRILSCAFFLGFVLFTTGFKKRVLTLSLSLFLVSAILSIQNEILIVRKLNLAIVVIAYLLLIVEVLPFVRKLKANGLQKVILIIILSLNVLLLFSLVEIEGYKIEDFTQFLLLILRGLCIIGMVIVAFSFTNRYSNLISIYFLITVFSLALSDLFAFVSFYMDIQDFIFLDRLFYLFGLSALAHYIYRCSRENFMGEKELI